MVSGSVKLAAAAAVAAVVWSCTPAPTPEPSIPPPTHHFLPDGRQHGGVLHCGISNRLEDLADIWHYPISPCRLDEGLTRPTRQGTSAVGTRARMTLWLADADWSTLSLQIRAHDEKKSAEAQTIRLSINGVGLPTTQLPPEWTTLTFPIPEGALLVGENALELHFRHAVSARETGRGKSSRSVAAVIEEVWLARGAARGGGLPRVKRLATDPPTGPAAPQIWDADRDRFIVSRRGTLALPIEVPAGSDQLELDVAVSDRLNLDASSIGIRIEGLDGTAGSTHSASASAPADDPDSRNLKIGISTGAFAGQTALAIIELDPRPRGATVQLGRPRLSPSRDRSSPADTPAQDPLPPAELPDIVLITLDAARADHCSCYGYPRPTTPMIDRFAEHGLVFRNAFALAPYTLCSVPTMITGMSFLDHGVVGHQDTLAPEATTLAESLAAAGYRTACFSASPNNSAAKGFDQGYDEFHELWKEAERAASRNPHYVTRRAVEWLEAHDDDRPIHLQVHYIPPHAPYEPEARFNIFADLSYGGPCTGRINSFAVVENGLVPSTERCVGHLIDLYDGNLRAADDATGRLLGALARRKRWSNTVVLITSDHGEAFLEHGKMTHNSTVYDEMLQVPFVLRLPSRFSGAVVDTDQLVTLADIVPTLLATAALPAPDPSDGVDLLQSGVPGANPSGRYFVARNSDQIPLLGLRSLRWKVLLSATGFGALFDLQADPAEQYNLVFEHPAEFAALGMILTDRVSRPPAIGPSAEHAEITSEDREMLEALGYVDGH